MTEKVSIIVPIYNVEQWLDECIESIINQTYKNLEIILVDDGSKDNSGAICDKWKLKDDRIIVIHKKNGGLSSSRNAGLDIFTGEYVTFCDSDDYIEKETIESMLSALKEKKVDIVWCAMNKIIDGKLVDNRMLYEEKIYSKTDMIEGYYYYKNDLCGSVCDKLFKATLFEKLRFPEGLNSEDYYVLFNIYLRVNTMFYNNKCFYNYRIRDNSICTTQTINEHSFDKIKISNEIKKITEKEIPEYVYDAEAFQIISRFFVYSENMHKGLSDDYKLKWLIELRQNVSKVLRNKKIDIKFKIKYLCIAYFPKIYSKVWKKSV